MFCVMLHQDARTALTETCHRKALWTSVFPLINSIVWATCIQPFENSKQVVCTFVIDYTVTYTYLTVKKCSSAYFFEVKAVPQKEAKHGGKKIQEVFVCFKRAHRRITSSGLAGRI